MLELRATLEDLDIQGYFDRLVEHGFNTWDSLVHINETDMKTLGIKLEHRRRLQREIARRTDHPSKERPVAAAPQMGEQRRKTDSRTNSGRSKRKYKRRSPRDPHAPTRPDTAYVSFAKYLRQDPRVTDLSFVEIAKLVGQRWSHLSDDAKGIWTDNAKAQRAEYKSALARYHQTEVYQAQCSGSKSKPRATRREAQVICNNTLLERHLSNSESDVPFNPGRSQAIENPINSLKPTHQVGFELAKSGSTACGSTASMASPIETSPSHYCSSHATSVCESDEADIIGPWKVIPQQTSNPDRLPVKLSYDNLLSSTFQESALPKSFHVKAINPFDFQSRAVILPIINSFLQNTNTVYYLVNPDDLWNYLHSALDTTSETPNLIMSTVCICIALGCETCPAGTTDMAIMWYENSRRYLDDCDWCLDPIVMQILALISMFHMAQRPATSSHYLDTAIRIGEANRLQKATEGVDQTGICWDVEWQNIWATIISMHQILLGCGVNKSVLHTSQALPSDNYSYPYWYQSPAYSGELCLQRAF